MEDRIYGYNIVEVEMCDLWDLIVDLNLVEMKVLRYFYIWFNGYVCNRIDRVLCNFFWVMEYGYIIVNF